MRSCKSASHNGQTASGGQMTGTVNVSKLKCADGSIIGVLELDNP
ncbi:enoyl-CoA hydratase/isomerase family protein, partial [Vibrio parahaemolyticus]|nr:enoyl-CoA hydratase/isomerase family protein [Vibrio parahaemolyticus]